MSSHPLATKSPTKNTGSPGQFVKPADLFKMRRRTSIVNNFNNNSSPSPSTFGSRSSTSNSQSNNNNNNNSSNSNSSCTTPIKNQTPNAKTMFNSPAKFFMEPQSPLKCLNNLSEPSPQKKLPVLLRNPFNQPAVKRRLNLGCSPKKDGSGKSPNKKTRMLGMDEDANLEPPKMKLTKLSNDKTQESCYTNDWTLKTKIRINFKGQCRNWNKNSSSIHKRRTGQAADYTPTKLNDKSISIDAIKNLTTVYQHPYLPWKCLYPRTVVEFDKKKEISFSLNKHPQVVKMMHQDWCESLSDLANLLIDGRCPYFYMCSDNYNILFKQVPSSNPKKPLVQAYISPFFYNMGCELKNLGVEFNYPTEIARSESSGALSTMDRAGENSQASFGSTRNSIMPNDDESSQSIRQQNCSKLAPSIDSGNISDLEDDYGEDENEHTSLFLESIGVSQQEIPKLQEKRNCFVETDSNTQTKLSSYKPLAIIEGTENLQKLVKFLHTNQLYTINKVGKFAFIPPTLLSPREFRLSTPQYPEVVLSKNMIESSASAVAVAAPATKKIRSEQKQQTPTKSPAKRSNEPMGPTHFELQGTILPHLYVELHKLLAVSDNTQHTCQSTPLNSSLPFKDIQFTL